MPNGYETAKDIHIRMDKILSDTARNEQNIADCRREFDILYDEILTPMKTDVKDLRKDVSDLSRTIAKIAGICSVIGALAGAIIPAIAKAFF